MTTYYVDSSSSLASDKNSGLSSATPFASLDAVNKLKLQPGDTVAFKAGTTYASTATGSASLVIKATGTVDKPITFTSYGTGDAPIIKNLATGYSDSVLLAGSKYVTIDGLNITGGAQAGINVDKNSSFITIKNVEASGVGEGVLLNGTNSLVTHSYFHDLVMIKNTANIADDDYGAVGITVGGNNNEISFTKIVNGSAPSYDYGRDGGGIELFNVSNIYIHDNWVENSVGFIEAAALKSLTMSNIIITNNVSLNNGDFLVLHNGTQYGKYQNIDASHNTIVNETNKTKEMATVFLDSAYQAGQLNFHDNVVYLNSGDSVFKQNGTYHSNNTFYLASSATHLYNNWSMALNAGETFGKLVGTPSGAALVAAVQSQSGRGGALGSDQAGLTPHAGAAVVPSAGAAVVAAVVPVAPTPAPPVVPLVFDTTGITGQSYVTEHKVLNTSGAIVLLERFHADGTMDSSQSLGADGSTTYRTYNAAGTLIQQGIANVDGSRIVDFYNVKGQSYTTQHITYDARGVITSNSQYHADGSKDYTTVLSLDGSTTSQKYDASGTLTVKVVAAASGGSVTTNFDKTGAVTLTSEKNAAGVQIHAVAYHADGTRDYATDLNADGSTTSQKYDASGTLTVKVVAAASGGSVTTNFDKTGAVTLTSEKNAAGVQIHAVAYHADGTRDYATDLNADGSTSALKYDASGKLASEVITRTDGSIVRNTYTDGALTVSSDVHKDGSQDIYQYNIAGKSYTASHASYDASKHLLLSEMFNNDGSHTVNVAATNVTVAGTAAKDVFTAYGADTFVFGSGSGKDTIYNFHAGSAASHDTISLSKSVASDFAHLALRQAGADVVIDLSAHDSITLKSVSLSALTHHDFLFV